MMLSKSLLPMFQRGLICRKLILYKRFDIFDKILNTTPCILSDLHIRKCSTNKEKLDSFTENSSLNVCQTREDVATRHRLKLDKAAENVFESCKKKDVMILSIGSGHIRFCLEYLTELGLHIKEVEELLIESPKIFSNENFQSKTSFLQENGFSPKQVASLYRTFPGILDMEPKKIATMLESLRSLGFYEAQLLKLLSYNSSLFLLEPAQIAGRVHELKELFKSRDILHLIVKSPFVLTEDMKVIHLKFNYVFHEMNISQRQMMYSDIFSHSLEHIKTRHIFLVRAGLYKIIKKEKGELNKNPLLQDIIDTSDKQFAKKFGNMSEFDYLTFKKMFEKEMKNKVDDFEYDSTDTDE